MANEARITTTLNIRKSSGTINTITYPSTYSFSADVDGTFGPAPGAFAASTAGTDVALSEFTTAGLCRITNQDATNYVTVGRWDSATSVFYPLMELLPGESYVIRLSRDVTEEYSGTGTGTTAAATTLRIKAANASCSVIVEAFEK